PSSSCRGCSRTRDRSRRRSATKRFRFTFGPGCSQGAWCSSSSLRPRSLSSVRRTRCEKPSRQRNLVYGAAILRYRRTLLRSVMRDAWEATSLSGVAREPLSTINRDACGPERQPSAEHAMTPLHFQPRKGMARSLRGLDSCLWCVGEQQTQLVSFCPQVWVERAIELVRTDFIRVEDHQHLVVRHDTGPGDERMQAVTELDGRAEVYPVAGDLMNILASAPQREPLMPQLT